MACPTAPRRGIVTVAPIRLNRSASSGGIASAPEPQIRTEVRSRSEAWASSSIRYIAGTPTKIVARRDSMASSTCTGWNLGRKYVGIPATPSPSRTTKPMMCATGSAITAWSRWSRAGHRTAAATWPTRARWLRAAPFGFPVVPEV